MSNDPNQPLKDPYAAPQAASAYQNPPQGEGDATGGVIPYKNMPALLAYYMGIVGMLPCIGLPFAIAAFILGIVGLMKRNANPAVKGSVHAWIGIVLGAIFSLAYGGGLIIAIATSAFK